MRGGASHQGYGKFGERGKHAGECRSYVGTQGLKGYGKEPIRAGCLITAEGFEGSGLLIPGRRGLPCV